MKIQNKEVSIKIGNKTKTFKNLILNSYLNLFADSFINFKNKDLPFCYVNLTKENEISENSSSMKYDTILEANFSNNIEILSTNNIVNKYYYKDPMASYEPLQNFSGMKIKQLGFGNYDYETNHEIIYAFLDVSKYDLYIQYNQPVVISRIDKVVSDMDMYASTDLIKAPIHLSTRGLLNMKGMEYETIIPKLHSVGFGIVPYKILKEYLVKDLNITRNSLGQIEINNNFYNYSKKGLYPNEELYPNNELYPREATYKLLIYKFKLYKEVWDNIEASEPKYVDTGDYYTQYKQIEKFGNFSKLLIKYERG